SEDRQIRRDDDGARVKDRTQHFADGVSNALQGRLLNIRLNAEVADGILDDHNGSVGDQFKIVRAQRKQVCGYFVEIEANGCKEEGERNRQGDDNRSAKTAKKEKENDGYEENALCQVVQDGVCGQMDQFTPVEKRHNLDA